MRKFIAVFIVLLFPFASLPAQTPTPVTTAAVSAADTLNKTDARGLKQGFWEEKSTNSAAKGWYKNGLKEGQWLTYGQNGILTRVENYHSGLKNGAVIDIDPRGYLSGDVSYVNDVLEGTAKQYYYGTNPASVIPYKHGKVNGRKIIYYENTAGKIQEEASFKDGIKDGPSIWYTITGDKVAEYNYADGNLEGIQRQYYPKSVLMSEQNYEKNIPKGEYKEYFESGKLRNQGIYVSGEKEGNWNEFDENGSIRKTTRFVKGVEK